MESTGKQEGGEDKEGGERPSINNTLKVIFVGASMSGKTSIIRSVLERGGLK